MHVADRLQASMDKSGSIACVGLDPRIELIPPTIRAWAVELPGTPREQVAAAFTRFNTEIIDAVAGACAAVKPQAACYEAFGAPGWQSLEDTIAHARSKGVQVILDAKRGDIGSTATHYRQGLLDGTQGLTGEAIGGLGADWLTASPYLGRDSVDPLLGEVGAHGLFILVKTSNPGAPDVQDLSTFDGDHSSVSARVADLVNDWGRRRRSPRGLSDIGAVVGATWPDEAKTIRSIMPESMFLVPGYGAQGGDGSTAVAGARSDGSGILVSSSRAINGAWQTQPDSEHLFAEHSRSALDAMNQDLNSYR